MKRQRIPNLNKTLFAAVWNVSPDLDTIAEHFGTTKESLGAIASRLRKDGWKIKRFRRGRKPRKVDAKT